MKSRLLIIMAIVAISLFIMIIVIPAYLYRQSNDLLTITYVCTTGLKPNAFSAYRTYDNGTHTINMDSCDWIETSSHRLPEFEILQGMSCEEIIERHASGNTYQNERNRAFAEHKISTCDFVDDWSETQKKVDDWD